MSRLIVQQGGGSTQLNLLEQPVKVVIASGIKDHGNLSGLGDDDHPHYFNTARANTWFGGKTTDDLSQGGSNLYSQWQTLAGGVNFAGGYVAIGESSPSLFATRLHITGTGVANDELAEFDNLGAGTSGIRFSYTGLQRLELFGLQGNRSDWRFTNSGGALFRAFGSGFANSQDGIFGFETNSGAAGASRAVIRAKAGDTQRLFIGWQSDNTEVFSVAYDGTITTLDGSSTQWAQKNATTTTSSSAQTVGANNGPLIFDCTAGVATTYTLDTGQDGQQVTVILSGAGQVDFALGTAEAIFSTVGSTPSITTQYGQAVCKYIAGTGWYISGDIV